MRLSKLLAALGVLSIMVLAAASPAAARKHGKHRNGTLHQRHKAFKCDGVFSGLTVRGAVVVPADAACTLMDSTVKGDVRVLDGAYFQGTGTRMRKDVRGERAETIFVDTGSSVGGSIRGTRTAQVFVFDSTVTGGISVKRASDKVQICGTTLRKGSIAVERSGTDILIGDPLAIDCAGNLLKRGSILVTRSLTDVEFTIRGNTIRNGGLKVTDNKGPSDKFVQSNVGGQTLRCNGNDSAFTASGNTGWTQAKGQCAGP
jgi:hypothetical protein